MLGNRATSLCSAIGYRLYEESRLLLACLQSVLHQHGDRHRPDAAWYRCNRAGFWSDFIEIDVAGDAESFLPAGVLNPSGAHIDHDSPLTNVLLFYKAGLPH